MRNKSNPLIKWFATLFVVLLGSILLIAVFSHHASSSPTFKNTAFINDNAASDTPVETLKTLTAEISTVEQQNKILVEQNKSSLAQDKTTLENFKSEMLAKVQQQMDDLKAAQVNNDQKVVEPSSDNIISTHDFPANHENDVSTDKPSTQWIWVQDLQENTALSADKTNADINTLLAGSNNKPQQDSLSGNKLNTGAAAKQSSIPYYTLPVNATLTGAIAMQPIIGRIPLDGKVVDPYTFKIIIGPKNLAANGVDIPADIQGIVATGVAKGDLLGKCARGDITSMTFIFQDGRISTTQAKEGQALGNIAAANGNPCLAGSFHTDAALYLGAETTLAGLQGYGNALSQAQMSNSTSSSTGASIATLIGSANKYAFGQSFAASSQAAQRWWDQRVQSSFDFIYVPNVDLKSHKKLELNINIIQEIPIDYDPKGRKVFYEHATNYEDNAQLD